MVFRGEDDADEGADGVGSMMSNSSDDEHGGGKSARRRRRSSSIIYKEPLESIEHISDQSALPNLNANWVNAKGGFFWMPSSFPSPAPETKKKNEIEQK